MSPGWMPSWPRPMRARRFLPYGRRRRVRKPPRTRSSEPVIAFGSSELPVATIHSIRGAFHRWADVRLAWLRPRALPALVALMALVGLLAVTEHLGTLAAHGDPVATAPIIVVHAPSAP